MFEIFKSKDINRYIKTGKIDRELGNHLSKYFLELYDALASSESLEDFSLRKHGHIIILYQGDTSQNLKKVGVPDGDFCMFLPEWVKIIHLGNGNHIYQVAVLFDNETMRIYYLKKGCLGSEVDSWLDSELSEEVEG